MKKFILPFLLIICIILCSLLISNFNNFSIKNTYIKTLSNDNISVRLFIPKNVKSAPAIVIAHGLSTTKECYNKYAISFAQNGYIVASIDMLNHGNSDIVDAKTIFQDQNSEAFGVYSVVKYLESLEYVDKSKIGILGHSMGGNACNNSIIMDNEQNNFISAVYLLSSNPSYKNIYKNRDVGVYYTTYDHVFFSTIDENNNYISPQKFLDSNEAKQFINFGEINDKKIEPNKNYTKIINNKKTIRRIDKSNSFHYEPQNSNKSVKCALQFFNTSFNIKNNNIFPLSELYSFFSFLGMIILLIFPIYLLKLFNLSPLNNYNLKYNSLPISIVNTLFPFISISIIFKLGLGYFALPQLPQQPTNIYAFWALLNGIFLSLTLLIFVKINKISLSNININVKNIPKSLTISIVIFSVILSIIYLSSILFNVDFRYFLWGFRPILFKYFYVFFIYLPFFFIFTFPLSIFIKISNNTNILIMCILSALPAIIITILGYYKFISLGYQTNLFGSNYTFTYMVHAIPVFPIAILLIKKLTDLSDTPYIPAFLTSFILIFMQVCTTFTCHTFLYFGPTK